MDIFNNSRYDRGVILPNKTMVLVQNADDEVIREALYLSDKGESETRLDDMHEDTISKSDKKEHNKITCSEWGSEFMPEDKDNGGEEHKKWYTFLDDLYSKFSEYDIQKDRQRYNVADLDDWDQTGKPQGISINTKTFKKFLDKIMNFNVAEYETIKNLNEITHSEMDQLNQVLSLTLNHTPSIMCEEPYIVVKGNFISLNETMRNLESNLDSNIGCKNFEGQLEAEKYSQLKIFALSKVFIDTDLMFSGKRISVAIIAPKWEVIGSRSIDLNGSDSTAHAEPKAKNGGQPGNNGNDGNPGKPGISGETFFGIGAAYVGGANLKINSIGGKGGLGQEGGDGAAGVLGKDAFLPSGYEDVCEKGSFKGFKCELGQKLIAGSKTIFKNYKINGLPGRGGGNGGMGGKGGKGGKAGNIQIIDFGEHSNIAKISSEGKDGEIGKGGIGGRGGKNGDDILTIYKYIGDRKCQFNCDKKYKWELKGKKRKGTSSSGKNGADGENATGLKDPEPARGINRPSMVINEYKIFLRENINNRFQKCTLKIFLNQLDSSDDVRKLYDILSLTGEFQDLEEQFFKLRNHIDVSPFYSSLLERIDAFARDQENNQISKESKKVLNYLYTAALSKIVGLRETSNQNLIIEMRGYLSNVVDNIKTLKDLQTINNKVDIINKYKNIYKNDFEKQIEEAQQLIEKQITPEFKKIYSNIDKQVNALVEQTIALQKKAEKDWDKLADKKKELQNSMAIKGLLNVFKIIGGVVSFLGPVGAVAGTVITGATTVGESLALSGKEKILNLPDPVAKDLKTLKDQIEEMRKQKVDYLDKVVKDLSNEIEKNRDSLGDMTSKVEGIKGKLEKVNNKELDFKVVRELETELEESIKRKGVDLKKDSDDAKNFDAVKALEKITKMVEFGSLFTKMYGEMKKDNEKLGTITTSMEEMESKIKMLREYENNIYETITPMLQKLEDHLDEVSAKLGTKSLVALDVTKWQVQSTLKNVNFQLQKLTKGHGDITDELKYNIGSLEEVMTTLINVYDRIQNYQDQQNLANYIADISSVAASSINIKDQELVNVVNRLEFAIRANMVIEQYKRAIDGLKQWVFPFVDHYIEESMLPSHLELEDNIENLVDTAMRQIQEIVKKLNLYDNCIVNGGKLLMCEEFSNRFDSTQPFFEWKNRKYRNLITRLLLGEEVLLKAEVEESAPHKDAIKFSEIDFDFKVKNETFQSLLNKILNTFDIHATHSGHSYYRYDDKITLITSNSVTLRFSLEKDDDGRPIRANDDYYRLKSGDLLLSPYTLWKIKLIQQTNKYSFKDLKAYKNKCNLELSGLGSYVEKEYFEFPPQNEKRSKRESFTHTNSVGLKQCRRPVRRTTRSINEMRTINDFMTSGGSKAISSPLDSFKFVKSSFVSFILKYIFPTFYQEHTSFRNDCSEFPDECTERKRNRPLVTNIVTIKNADTSSAKSDFIKKPIGNISDIVFDVNFNGKNTCLNSFLLSDEKDKITHHSTQFSDLNCSLLLADLVTRTITGNRYKSSVGDHLLSPREIMLRNIFRGAIQNESGMKQMLKRHQAEKEAEKSNSLFNKLKSYSMSMLRVFGLLGNTDTEQYILDIRNLFA